MNRDLDAEIVKTIFKWRFIPVSADAKGENACEILYPPNKEPDQDFYNTLPLIGAPHIGWSAPRYSSDLYTAINLCKHVNLPLTIKEMSLNPEILSKGALDFYKIQNNIL